MDEGWLPERLGSVCLDLVVSEQRVSYLDLGDRVAVEAAWADRPETPDPVERPGPAAFEVALRALTFASCRMAWSVDACVSVAVNFNQVTLT